MAVICAVAAPQRAGAQVTFSGGDQRYAVVDEKPAANTGLNHIYVVYDTEGVDMCYTAQSGGQVTVYTFDSRGGAYAEPAAGAVTEGNVTTLYNVKPDCGYIVEEGSSRIYLWVVDYAGHRLRLRSVEPQQDSDCGVATLSVDADAGDIAYYTINGVRKTLSRELQLSYYNLVDDEQNSGWNQQLCTDVYESLKQAVALQAPYCDTQFTITGDKYLRQWGLEESVTSGIYHTNAVAVLTRADKQTEEAPNRKNAGNDDTALGGSAPVTVTFTASCTDAVSHKQWQMATDMNFEDIQLRVNDETAEYTFDEMGTSYWRFVGTNASGECEAVGETYTVDIGESALECPNAFSPGVSEGVNDEWRVSYKNIVEFRCWIYNTWGNLMCQLNSPAQGWDGRYKGHVVKPGVFYYVIEAKGADGKKYNLNGDINVVGYRQGPATGTPPAGN